MYNSFKHTLVGVDALDIPHHAEKQKEHDTKKTWFYAFILFFSVLLEFLQSSACDTCKETGMTNR